MGVVLLAGSAAAQTITSAVPGFISYQGKVTNAAGTAVGAGTPVNRKVIFRIWAHQSNSTVSDLVYSEEQTVTISEGEFSVLIGQGVAVNGTPLGYSESGKGPPTVTVGSTAVFGGATRFLGVTVDDGTAAADPEVSPRQQLVTSGYAFRAKYAESVGANGVNTLVALDNGNIGVGASNPGAKLEVAGNIRAGGAGIANPQLQLLANSASTVAASVGYANAAGNLSTDSAAGDTVFRTDNSGKLHLQTGTGAAALTVSGLLIGINAPSPTAMLQIGTGANRAETGLLVNTAWNNAADRTEGRPLEVQHGGTVRLVVNTDGNVGVGVNVPRDKVEVAGGLLMTGGYGNFLSGALNTVTLGGAGASPNAGSIAFGSNGGWKLNFGTPVSGVFTPRVTFVDTGDVGIGTTSPSSKLNVVTATNTYGLTVGDGTREFGAYLSSGSNAVQIGSKSNHPLQFFINGGAAAVTLTTGNRVGIGTASPSAPLHVAGTGSVTGNLSYYIDGFGHGGPWGANPYSRSDISIYASNSIVCPSGFFVISDARTKNVIGVSNGKADLATLSRIQVTDFTFRDVPELGARVQKKVVAQQVEQVFPQAVSRFKDVVADIFKPATIVEGWIQLATDLRPGERVRLITEAGTKDVHEVLEVSADRFRTAALPAGKKVFVYGREVDDFRIVDYEAISMLNVSATQELRRQNEALTKRVAELEARDRARDEKLAVIEKLLGSNQTVMARPAARISSGTGGQE